MPMAYFLTWITISSMTIESSTVIKADVTPSCKNSQQNSFFNIFSCEHLSVNYNAMF
jgi:hypothetical protein